MPRHTADVPEICVLQRRPVCVLSWVLVQQIPCRSVKVSLNDYLTTRQNTWFNLDMADPSWRTSFATRIRRTRRRTTPWAQPGQMTVDQALDLEREMRGDTYVDTVTAEFIERLLG